MTGPLDSLPSGEWQIEPLCSEHDVSAFACGVPEMDAYLQNNALKSVELGVGATRVLVRLGERIVLGYFTLSNATVVRDELPKGRRNRPQGLTRSVPATLLGRLAVAKGLQGQRLGGLLLMEALRVAVQGTEYSASYAVVLDPLQDDLVGFYERFGFRALQSEDHPGRLFVPIRDIRGLTIAEP